MINLDIGEEFISLVNPTAVEAAARAALAQTDSINRLAEKALQLGASAGVEVELNVVIAGDELLQELNSQYLDIQAPTDVLSFNTDELEPGSGRLLLGDVLISFPQAENQARQGGHSPEAELQLLTIHGVLHLLGHDHASAAEKEKMWTIQAEALRQVGCPLAPP